METFDTIGLSESECFSMLNRLFALSCFVNGLLNVLLLTILLLFFITDFFRFKFGFSLAALEQVY